MGGWRCGNCLLVWEKGVKERMAAAVKAWEEHLKVREEKAEEYAAAAAAANAQAKEAQNHGFLVGEVDVVGARVGL